MTSAGSLSQTCAFNKLGSLISKDQNILWEREDETSCLLALINTKIKKKNLNKESEEQLGALL